MLASVIDLFQPWADAYSDSHLISTSVIAVHLLSMFIGGGVAIAADRRVLQAEPGTAEAHRAVAEDLKAQHGLVIGTLIMVVLSGLLLFTADLKTFIVSVVFWVKMGAFGVLLINGFLMRRTEAQVVTAAKNTVEFSVIGPDLTLPWSALRRAAWVSLICWCAIVLLGVLVTNT